MHCLTDWLFLVLICTLALFIIPHTPDFTLLSTSASVLNVTTMAETETQNLFTANLGVQLHVYDSNPIASTSIYCDDSFHVSLFHGKANLSSFSVSCKYQNAAIIEALFPNVSLMVDEWTSNMDHGCGYAYLDLWLSANARFTKLQAHCQDVKFELCSSSVNATAATTVVVNSLNASCNVDSNLVPMIRLVMVLQLILLVGTSMVIHLLVGYFFCSSRFTHS